MGGPTILRHQELQCPQVGRVPWKPVDLPGGVCDAKSGFKWKPTPEGNGGDALPGHEPPLAGAAQEHDAFCADLHGSEPVHAEDDDRGDNCQGKRGRK